MAVDHDTYYRTLRLALGRDICTHFTRSGSVYNPSHQHDEGLTGTKLVMNLMDRRLCLCLRESTRTVHPAGYLVWTAPVDCVPSLISCTSTQLSSLKVFTC